MSQVFVVPGLTRRVEDRQHMRRAVSHGLPRIIRHQADESVPFAVELGAEP